MVPPDAQHGRRDFRLCRRDPVVHEAPARLERERPWLLRINSGEHCVTAAGLLFSSHHTSRIKVLKSTGSSRHQRSELCCFCRQLGVPWHKMGTKQRTTPPALPSDNVSSLGWSTMRPAATEARITSLAAGWQPTTVMRGSTDFSSAAMPAQCSARCAVHSGMTYLNLNSI